LGIFGIAEEHAFVSESLLVFAYTAWLLIVKTPLSIGQKEPVTLTLAAA
jgi:hypothetical protein